MTQGDHDTDLRQEPIADLLKRLSQQTADLVRQELELAKAEFSQKGRKAGQGAGMFGAAGATALAALGALTACLILALNHAVADWLAALIVAVAWAAVAGILALRGREKVQEAAPAVPEQTVETVKEDVQWAKNRTQSARR
jgi:MFS family permease